MQRQKNHGEMLQRRAGGGHPPPGLFGRRPAAGGHAAAKGGVQQAAQAAAKGDTRELMDMMNQLMSTPEGAQLVERINRKAKESGLG